MKHGRDCCRRSKLCSVGSGVGVWRGLEWEGWSGLDIGHRCVGWVGGERVGTLQEPGLGAGLGTGMRTSHGFGLGAGLGSGGASGAVGVASGAVGVASGAVGVAAGAVGRAAEAVGSFVGMVGVGLWVLAHWEWGESGLSECAGLQARSKNAAVVVVAVGVAWVGLAICCLVTGKR